MASFPKTETEKKTMAAEHEAILKEANIDLVRLGKTGPLSEESGEDVARVINDVMDWELAQIKSHFDRFLTPDETKVFINFKKNATTLTELLVNKGGDVEALATEDAKALFKLISAGSASKTMLFRDEFRLILSHIDEVLSPKAAMELVAELSQYFAKGCDAVDVVNDRKLAAAKIELEAARTAASRAPNQAKKNTLKQAEKAYVANIRRCCRDRCLAVRVENGICIEEPKRGIVGARQIAPPGYIDRVMATPNGWTAMLCTADGTLDRGGEKNQLAEHFGALALTIASGRSQMIQSIGEVDEVAFYSAPGSASFVGYERLRELGKAGMRWEALNFICSMLPPMIEHQLMPAELFEKISFNGVMSDTLPKGSLGYSNFGKTLLDEIQKWDPKGIRAFVANHDKGDEIVGKLVNSTMRLLLRPKSLGINAKQAKEIAKCLGKIEQFGSPRCDDDLVSSARDLLSVHGASAKQAEKLNNEYLEKKRSRFSNALTTLQSQENVASKKHDLFIEALRRAKPLVNIESVASTLKMRFEQKDSQGHEAMQVVWLDATDWALARVDSDAIEAKLPNINPARIRKEIRDSWKNVKDGLDAKHPGLAQMADELYTKKHLLARGSEPLDMVRRLAAQRKSKAGNDRKPRSQTSDEMQKSTK
jgi:hypothetical protein